ncbi:hypothetical protein INT47_006363 [Mucor saturninus]|uniref:Methyltransferase domain-containing protein n=1 Tax=Mucor saturninus TaxID=64648 RepID=A0A8H7RKD4_9FUNG|nr:hypothetical protein INT47_006363 [Mucor saturninus]
MTHTKSSDIKVVDYDSPVEYITRDGRLYNANTDYLLPVDEGESLRLSRFPVAHNYLFGAPFAERLEKGIVVLDSACGAGAHWSKAMGEKYPSSVFTGVDISNVFPSESFSNIEFKMGNIPKSIPFPDETFDFSFQKLLGLPFTSEEWDSNSKELHRILKPGGYIELSEIYGVSAHNIGPLMSQVMHAL